MISLQVKDLEDDQKIALVRRRPGGGARTAVGAAIQAGRTSARATLAAAADLAAARDRRTRVVAACIIALLRRWLAHRLGDVSARLTDSRIAPRAEADPVDCADGCMAIRMSCGPPLDPDRDSRALITDGRRPPRTAGPGAALR